MNSPADDPDGTGADEDVTYPRGDPPGPTTLPYVGSALPFFRNPFEYRTRIAAEYGDVVDVSGLGKRAFLLSHPKYVKRVLVTDSHRYTKPDFEKQFVERAFGDSLAFIDRPEWTERRRMLQPVFTMDRIEQYGATMVEYAEALADEWDDGEVIALDAELKRLTFQVLARTLFGLDRQSVPDLYDDFEAVATKLRPMKAVVPDWIPTPTNRRYELALSDLETAIDDLIERRRATDSGPDDLLTLLLAAADGEALGEDDERADTDGLSDRELRDELMGFLFAGHETTAMALTFSWYLLETHASARDEVHQELDAVLGGGRPDVTDLGDLDYLEHAITEGMRLYPPNHMIPREPLEDVAIGGYRIPEGASVYCSQWVIHRDERWYDQPEAYRPERWAGDEDRPEYAYFPFGGGPHHCIGMRFARMEIRLALATLMEHVTLEPVDHSLPDLAAGLTMHPKDRIEMRVHERESAETPK
jgi:cytochrome P450